MKLNEPSSTSENLSENEGVSVNNCVKNDTQWEEDDALWDLLGKASEVKVDSFFARDIVRKVRMSERVSFGQRVLSLIGSRVFQFVEVLAVLSIGAFFIFPFEKTSSDQDEVNQPASAPIFVEVEHVSAPSSDDFALAASEEDDLSELVMEETLQAVADDPTLFTRDEVVVMLGL